MSESTLRFDTTEAQIVAQATNSAVTRRRICYSVLFALALAIFWRDAQPRLLLWLFVGYVAINMFEKVAYGIAVSSYKSVIRKLLSRVSELEGGPISG